MAARGFFAFHRVPLQFRTGEKKRLSEKSRVTEDYYFSLADIKQLSDLADLEERYVLIAGKSFGLRASDFLKLTRGDLEPHINDEAPISIGRRETKKEKVPAYPFIDSDAQEVIKTILAKIAVDGRTRPTDRILLFKNEIDLTRALKRLIKRSGLNVGNRIVRFHCLRKFLCDHLSSHMSESKWKQIVGKKISEGAYIGVESLRADYKRAMAETCFSKNFGDIEKRLREVEDLKKQLPPETLKRMQELDMLRSKTTKGRRYLETEAEADKKKDPCPKGSGKCQKIVSEADLGELLANGWKMVGNLPSGKIVVSNEA